MQFFAKYTGGQGSGGLDKSSPLWLVELFLIFTLIITFLGLFGIHKKLHNPFGTARIDIAHEIIFNGIRRFGESLFDDSAQRLPPSLAPPTRGRDNLKA